MATIDDVAVWATSTMLKRNDIISEARDAALKVYKLICGKVPFEALQRKSSELPCQAGVDSYDLTAAPYNLALAGIMSIRYTASPGQMWRMRRSHTRTYDAVTFTTGQNPRTYARFGNSIEFMPAPNSSSATFRVRFWGNPTIEAIPQDTVLICPDIWQELLDWETMYRLYYIVGEPEKAMSLIMPSAFPRQPAPSKTRVSEPGIIPRLWNDLLQTITQRENVDEDFSVNPIIRPYTNG